jgi:hypothetical protein
MKLPRHTHIKVTAMTEPTMIPIITVVNAAASSVVIIGVTRIAVVVVAAVLPTIVLMGSECVTLTVTVSPVELDNALFKRDSN